MNCDEKDGEASAPFSVEDPLSASIASFEIDSVVREVNTILVTQKQFSFMLHIGVNTAKSCSNIHFSLQLQLQGMTWARIILSRKRQFTKGCMHTSKVSISQIHVVYLVWGSWVEGSVFLSFGTIHFRKGYSRNVTDSCNDIFLHSKYKSSLASLAPRFHLYVDTHWLDCIVSSSSYTCTLEIMLYQV